VLDRIPPRAIIETNCFRATECQCIKEVPDNKTDLRNVAILDFHRTAILKYLQWQFQAEIVLPSAKRIFSDRTLELAFCDQTSNRLSPHCATFCHSNGMIISLFETSAHSLDNCNLQQAFKHDNRQHWGCMPQDLVPVRSPKISLVFLQRPPRARCYMFPCISMARV